MAAEEPFIEHEPSPPASNLLPSQIRQQQSHQSHQPHRQENRGSLQQQMDPLGGGMSGQQRQVQQANVR